MGDKKSTSNKKIFTPQNIGAVGRGIKSGSEFAAGMYNRKVAEQNEALANLYGLDAYQRSHRRSRRIIGQQIANRGASGLQNMGSVASIIEQSMREAEHEASAAKWQFDMQAIQQKNQQKLETTKAFTTLAGDMFSEYGRSKLEGEKDA